MGIQERKTREKDLRRHQIENAAKDLFLSKGFHSTTMEEIAQKAELSPGTLYLYFKNKGELYFSLNLLTLQSLFDQVEKVYKNNKLPVELKMSKFKDALYHTYQDDPLILRNILHLQLEDTLFTLSRNLRDEITGLSKKVMRMIADVYQEGVRQGKFRKGHSMAHADIVWSMFTGLVIYEESKKRINPRKNFLKPSLDKAFDIFCRGIMRRNGNKH